MATQSPLSFLDGLVERAAQAVQPPAWLFHETQQRAGTLSQPCVDARAAKPWSAWCAKTGRVARVQWRNFNMALVVTPRVVRSGAGGGAPPTCSLEVTDTNPLALAQAALTRWQARHLRIEGDVQLAADINWLVENVEWDVEEDLARIMGDVPAHTLATLARTVGGRDPPVCGLAACPRGSARANESLLSGVGHPLGGAALWAG